MTNQVTGASSGSAKLVALGEQQQRASLYCPVISSVQTNSFSAPLKGLFCSNNSLLGSVCVLLLGACVLS